eukprot:jgi/Ulvmu1/7425/UM036_0086.1
MTLYGSSEAGSDTYGDTPTSSRSHMHPRPVGMAAASAPPAPAPPRYNSPAKSPCDRDDDFQAAWKRVKKVCFVIVLAGLALHIGARWNDECERREKAKKEMEANQWRW